MTARTPVLLLALSFGLGCQQPATEQTPPTPQPAPTEVVAQTPAPTPASAPALLPNLKEPLDGVISGGQPTPEQLTAARDAGYKTVINLRRPDEKGVGEEAAIVADLGMDYLSIPIDGSAGLTKENTLAFAAALEEAEYPVVIHCGSGNRIGALFALKAFWVDGKNTEEALQIGLDAGLTRLEGAVAEILDSERSH